MQRLEVVLEQTAGRRCHLGGLRAVQSGRARYDLRQGTPQTDHGKDWLTRISPDSQLARDAFSTFIPISVDSDARTKIIFDFFELLAAIAAHGKSNGLGGRKLSRYAGWWAFEHADTGNGFEAAYKNWSA